MSGYEPGNDKYTRLENEYAVVSRLLDASAPGRLHSMGITGIGLSGLSFLFRHLGWEVSGCDSSPSPEQASWLEAAGIRVLTGHAPSHISAFSPDLIIRSPAVRDDSEELAEAKSLSIPCVCRGAALAAIVSRRPSIAVCGAHGKTTTSCFTVSVLKSAGLNPSWCIGGETTQMGGVALEGNPSDPLVVEADESDGTLALYHPSVLVFNSADIDHLEHFSGEEDLYACYGRALSNTGIGVAYCAESPVVRAIVEKYSPVRDGFRKISFGFTDDSFVRAVNQVLHPSESEFELVVGGKSLGRVVLSVPGRHNILNALGALSAAILVSSSLDEKRLPALLSSISLLPKRRFQEKYLDCGILLISDYSHHPAEIKALIETAKLHSSGRIVAVFQPHRYTRTKALLRDFPGAFAGVDVLALLPVYAASEDTLPGGSSADLYAEFRLQAENDSAIPVPCLVDSIKSASDWLRSFLVKGDTLLVVGAGSVVRIFQVLPELFAETTAAEQLSAYTGRDYSLAAGSLTSFGIGGTADLAFKVSCAADIRRALSLASACSLPVRVIGGGTNLLVPDTGIRGVTLVLEGEEYTSLAIDKVGGYVVAGAALSGAFLLNKLREAGLSGLEYMAGIPGTVGGWLAMNAGTRSGSFGDRVVSFTSYGYDGQVSEIKAEDAGFSYRRCAALSDRIATSVTLRLTEDFPALIKNRMDSARENRFNFAGLRTAGSVFRNPPDTSAGKLLDEAGCKGMRVGGASVCDRHANIIHVDQTATASDVIALSSIMHDIVLSRTGIDLQREIKIWF